MNSREIGNIALGRAISHFTATGLPVSIPLTDTQKYDLIVDFCGHLKKIQVKYSTSKNGLVEVPLRTIRCNSKQIKVDMFDRSNIDYLFVLDSNDIEYIIPAEEIRGKTSIRMKNKWMVNRTSVPTSP